VAPDDLKRWRREQRQRLIEQRLALPRATVDAWRRRVDTNLAQAFPAEPAGILGLCWPVKNEYDARHFARTLRGRGWLTALPVVVAPQQPLVFREWHPGVALAEGPMRIAQPAGSRELTPDIVLLPVNGWDDAGYRLGYGGGYFDRTLARLATKPLVIGVGYEMARIATIHPQAWDVPLDYLATEARLYKRGVQGLSAFSPA
jgi:5-formyltetrahydrofolate cyclo-ligase